VFLLDDILLSPMKALLVIGRHVQEAAENNLQDQERAILNSLAELHQLLESGAVGDEVFDARETALLDRLEAIQGMLKPFGGPSISGKEE